MFSVRLVAFAVAIALLAALPSPALQAGPVPPVRLCNSTEFWPPYSFLKGERLEGEHIEILDAAFADLGITMEQVYLPWKRCQDRVAAGEIDGVIGVSYSTERNAVFHFPADAAGRTAPDAISQVEFVVTTRADTQVPAHMSVETLPEPVGVLLGYRSADTIRDAGKETQVVAQQSSLFQMLERGRIASAVALRGSAIHFVEVSEEPLVIHEPALWSTPHFLAFSRKTGVSADTREKIWAAIKAVRTDTVRMAQIRAQVNELLDPCYDEGKPCQ